MPYKVKIGWTRENKESCGLVEVNVKTKIERSDEDDPAKVREIDRRLAERRREVRGNNYREA